MAKVNCAIYTRKSTEKGLDMEFNSLQNQEEACKAYILSQAFNGWEYTKTYSDGGISGGTMERPALQSLLNDIREGHIQVVVVYKVDRFSRSIVDFHKMMQEFNKYGCNFVSITQSFDTSNSMGKLTLNMLLSFAQFEREVSAERVRDKIAASKAKGLWMGGTPPLGYDVKDRQLVPNIEEAKLVNLIFRKYMETGDMREVADWLNEQGYRSKRWQTKQGHTRGGNKFVYGAVQRILGNPVYIGKITYLARHKVYVGKHQGILDKGLFEAVQAKISAAREGLRKHRQHLRNNTLLAGVLYNPQGKAYKISSGRKGSRVFKYYTITGESHLPVEQLDRLVLQAVQEADYRSVMPRGSLAGVSGPLIKPCIQRVISYKKGKECCVEIKLQKEPLMALLENSQPNGLNLSDTGSDTIRLSADGQSVLLYKSFYMDNVSSTRLQHGSANNILTLRELNESLVRGLSRGWQCKKLLARGMTTEEREKASKMNKRTFRRYLNLCYLAPEVTTAVLEYKNPRNFTLRELMDLAENEVDFERQIQVWNASNSL